MLVSRLITRTSGATSSRIGSASPQGQAKPAGRGIRPWARSARRTYARASAAYLSRSSGSPGCGRTWSTPRPVITSPHKNRVSSPSPTSPTLPRHRQHAATEDPPSKPPLILLTLPNSLLCAALADHSWSSPFGLKRWVRPAGGLSGLGQVPAAWRLRRHAGDGRRAAPEVPVRAPDGRWHNATTPFELRFA